MGRRLLVLMCCALVVSAAAPGGCPHAAGPSTLGASAPSVEGPRPNVLLLVSDDQAWSDFTPALMPSLFAQLVDQGVLFKRAYVNTSLCCPSRAQIVTGLYEHHTGVDTNTVPLERPTIVEALHDSGYRTMLAGKYLNSWPCTPRPEFDRWACVGTPTPSTYSMVNPVINVDGEWSTHLGYQTDILADQSWTSSSPPRRTSRSSRCTRRRRRTCRRTILRYDTMPITPPRDPVVRRRHDPRRRTAVRAPATAHRERDRERRLPVHPDGARRPVAGRLRGDHPSRPRRPVPRHARHLPLRQRVPVRRAPAFRQDRRVRGVRARAHGDPLSRDARLGVHVAHPRLERGHRAHARVPRRTPVASGRSLIGPPARRLRQERPVGAADRALPRCQRGIRPLFRLVVLRAPDASRWLSGGS